MEAGVLAGFWGDYCGECPDYPSRCNGIDPPDHMDCHFMACCRGPKCLTFEPGGDKHYLT